MEGLQAERLGQRSQMQGPGKVEQREAGKGRTPALGT